MAKPKKPKSFGRGFDLLLRHCEEWEDFFQGRTERQGRDFDFNDDLFNMISTEDRPDLQEEYTKYVVDMAENSWRLRNSFKFKLDWQEQAEGATEHVAQAVLETPLSLPFPQCVFYLENFVDGADLVLLLDGERNGDHIKTPEEIEAYGGTGIERDSEFVAIMPTLYRRDGILLNRSTGEREHSRHLSFMPIEIHLAAHKTAGPPDHNIGIRATPAFCRTVDPIWTSEGSNFHMQLVSAAYFVLWLLSRQETRRIPGLSARNGGMTRPKGKRQFYEHHVVDIDPFAVKQVSGNPSGIKKGSPRFHAVRGFWRHYKQPIKSGPHAGQTKVWIDPQWRGDKEKGVITKDYNILRSDRGIDDE